MRMRAASFGLLGLLAAVRAGTACQVAPEAAAPAPVKAAAAGDEASAPASGAVRRVGGDREATVEVIARTDPKDKEGANFEEYRFGRSRVDTPLPAGYPRPTPPGAIEIKTYPSVRRAEVSGSIRADMGMNAAFWPLFRHIQRRDIAMTAPVEMDYRGMQGGAKPGADKPDAEKPGRDVGESAELTSDAWTMSFLYRTPELGPTGEDGNVKIVDTSPVTVLAVGFTGPYVTSQVERQLKVLDAWLEAQNVWEKAGEPRGLYYNGPDVSTKDRWGEVQVPVRLKGQAKPEGSAPAEAPKAEPGGATPAGGGPAGPGTPR